MDVGNPRHLLGIGADHLLVDADLVAGADLNLAAIRAARSLGGVVQLHGRAGLVDLLHVHHGLVCKNIPVGCGVTRGDGILPCGFAARREAAGLHLFAVVVVHLDGDIAIVLHVLAGRFADGVLHGVACDGNQGQGIVFHCPVVQLIAVIQGARGLAIALIRLFQVDLAGILSGVGVAALLLDGDRVLGLVGCDDRIAGRHLGIQAGGISDGNLLALRHLGEGVIKAVGRAIVGISVVVSRDFHVFVEDERIAGNLVLDVDVLRGAVGGPHLDGVAERTGGLVELGALLGKGVGIVSAIQYDILLDATLPLRSLNILGELNTDAHAEGDVSGSRKPVIIGIGLVKFHRHLAVGVHRGGGRDIVILAGAVDGDGDGRASGRGDGDALRQLVIQLRGVIKLLRGRLLEGQVDVVVLAGADGVAAFIQIHAGNREIGDKVRQVVVGLCVRHTHFDDRAVHQRDRQLFIAGEGGLAGEQEVLLPHVHVFNAIVGDDAADLLHGDQAVVGEFDGRHVGHVQRGPAIYNM